MGEVTSIAWTHHTFNPWIGCTKVHAGCTHCYAESLATGRLGRRWGSGAERRVTSESNWKQPLRWAKAADKAGERRRVFCASLADVLDEEAPSEAQAELWDLIWDTPELDWLVLTKRPERARLIPANVRPRIWLGTSISDQKTADEWLPRLLEADGFRVRFVSAEPLLGPIDLGEFLPGDQWFQSEHPMNGPLNWVIVGGESGSKRRPSEVAWYESIAAQCAAAGVPVFMKQDTAQRSGEQGRLSERLWALKQFPAAAMGAGTP